MPQWIDKLTQRRRRVVLVLVACALGGFLRVGAIFVPTGQTGTGAGAVSVNDAKNVSIGTSSVLGTTKLFIVASSTGSGNLVFRVADPALSPYLVVRNDGVVSIAANNMNGDALQVDGGVLVTGTLTAGGVFLADELHADVPAANVTPGVFDSTNGSTSSFAFAGKLGIATTTTSTIPQTLSVYGGAFVSSSLGVGTASPVSKMEVHDVDWIDVSFLPYVGQLPGSQNLSVFTTNAPAINQGGTLGLGGRYSGASVAAFGAVAGIKETAGSDSAGYLSFMTNDGLTGVVSERMRLTSGGLLGVGTTTPAYKLDVNGPLRLRASTVTPTGNKGVIYYHGGSTDKFRCYQGSAWTDCIQNITVSGETNRVGRFSATGVVTSSMAEGPGQSSYERQLNMYLPGTASAGMTIKDGYFLVASTTAWGPSASSGVQLIWSPFGAALRAGYVQEPIGFAQWDAGSRGDFSTAFGHEVRADKIGAFGAGGGTPGGPPGQRLDVGEDYSAAFGWQNLITNTGPGEYAFAAGSNNIAGSLATVAFGTSTIIQGRYGVVFGYSNYGDINSDYTMLAGIGNSIVTAPYSTLFGMNSINRASANYSFGAGELIDVDQRRSYLAGYNNKGGGNFGGGSAYGSATFGSNNYNFGHAAAIFGTNASTSANYQTAIGRSIQVGVIGTGPTFDDAVNSVGIGLDTTHRVIATSTSVMAIMGGNLGIGTSTPNSRVVVTGGDLYVVDNTKGVVFKTPNGSACYRLTINNSGVTSTASTSCPGT